MGDNPNHQRSLLQWLWFFAAANWIIYILLLLPYAKFVYPPVNEAVWFYFPLALIGHTAVVVFVFYLTLSPAALIPYVKKTVIVLGWAAASIISILLIADFAIYSKYQFHIDPVVLQLFFVGGSEVFEFPLSLWLGAISGVVAVFVVQALIGITIWRKLPSFGKTKRATYAMLAFAFISIIGSNIWHAWATATEFRPITMVTRHIPLFHPLTANRFFNKYKIMGAGMPPQGRGFENLETGARGINYPLSPLECRKLNDMNILFVVVDSMRFDMLNAEVMPNLHNFVTTTPTFNFHNHTSGGNGTRIGIFSIFYGMYGTYWDSMETEKVGPVLIKTLKDYKYQFGIFSSATLLSPPFNRTVFSDIENLRVKTEGETGWQRDQKITEEWLQWLENRDRKQPFMGFLFYDSAHSMNPPPDYPEVFQPMLQKISYPSLNNDYDPVPFRNRYKTTINYVDSLVGKVISDLKAKGLLSNTLIIFTGDHGQEFNENKHNSWGHGSNFTKYQVQVPLAVYWPGRKGTDIFYKTSHYDIVPTIMNELLGCVNDYTDYSNGKNLFQEGQREWLFAGGFSKKAIIEKDRINVSYPVGSYEIYNSSNDPLADARIRMPVVKEALTEMVRFYRTN